MFKKIAIVSVLGIMGAGAWWAMIQSGATAPKQSTASEILGNGMVDASVRAHAPTAAAVGWSTAEDSGVAVREAVAMLKERLGGKDPKYVLASFTVLHDGETTIHALRQELGSKVQIHGLTTVNGLMTNDGLKVGKVVGLLGVASPEVSLGVGNVDPDVCGSLEEAGKLAIEKAIVAAGHAPTERPDIILFSASMRRGGEMKLLDGIASVVGSDVPVMGGNAGDEKFDHTWQQFTQDASYHEGLVLTAVFTKHKLGWAFESAFRITDKTGIVTKSDGKTIYEIDNRPALDVYNEWLNGGIADFISKSGEHWNIAGYTAQFPLCKVLHGPNGQVGYMTSHPVPKEEDVATKTLPVYALIEEGSRIQLFSGSWQTILNRAELVPANSLIRGEIQRDDAMFGMLFFCGGAYNCIPESERSKIPLLVNNAMGNVPFMGVITVGEQGYLPGICNVSANLVESMVTVGKK